MTNQQQRFLDWLAKHPASSSKDAMFACRIPRETVNGYRHRFAYTMPFVTLSWPLGRNGIMVVRDAQEHNWWKYLAYKRIIFEEKRTGDRMSPRPKPHRRPSGSMPKEWRELVEEWLKQ